MNNPPTTGDCYVPLDDSDSDHRGWNSWQEVLVQPRDDWQGAMWNIFMGTQCLKGSGICFAKRNMCSDMIRHAHSLPDMEWRNMEQRDVDLNLVYLYVPWPKHVKNIPIPEKAFNATISCNILRYPNPLQKNYFTAFLSCSMQCFDIKDHES